MGILTGALAVIIVYVYLQNNWVQVEHIDVAINNLPEELKGLKIAHVSDVHIPLYAPDIEKLIIILQREKPDIIALTGDILDGSGKWDNPDLIKFCTSLADIAVTYAVRGNHEARRRDAGKWERQMIRSAFSLFLSTSTIRRALSTGLSNATSDMGAL